MGSKEFRFEQERVVPFIGVNGNPPLGDSGLF